jgi:hypothetical protein
MRSYVDGVTEPYHLEKPVEETPEDRYWKSQRLIDELHEYIDREQPEHNRLEHWRGHIIACTECATLFVAQRNARTCSTRCRKARSRR